MIRQRKSFSPIRPRRAAWAARCALAAALALGASVPGRAAPAAELPVLTVQAAATAQASSYDGQVEALRQSVVAAQVPGRVLELNVHAGDTVRAGQVLLRIDAQAAEQSAAASGAQVAAARAQLDVASTELARKRQLAQKATSARPRWSRPKARCAPRRRRWARCRRRPAPRARRPACTCCARPSMAWWHSWRSSGRHGHAGPPAADGV
jgi:multidrug efflux pump subunit AcrA (membrane-fusion protein)